LGLLSQKFSLLEGLGRGLSRFSSVHHYVHFIKIKNRLLHAVIFVAGIQE
jgi:hypothetical protein